MGHVAKRRIQPVATSTSPADQPLMDWERLDDRKRQIAEERLLLISPILESVENGQTRSAAIKQLMVELEAGQVASEEIQQLIAKHGRADKPISRATWNNWVKAYEDGGKVALAPGYKGSSRKEWGWEARFHFYYDRPTRPKVLTVAYWLRTKDGFESATNDRVYRYAKSLSSKQGPNSRKRSGGHYYDQNIRPYRLLDTTVLPVGYMYEADGHTCDVYVQHPVSGNHYRPELTVWLDKRSHYIVAWTLSESENALNTIRGLLQAVGNHDHVPAQVHVDPGSGFKNKAVSDHLHGVCARLSIEPRFALPGNARGKGLVEGFFGHFEERVGKLFASFCGHCRTDDALSRLEYKIRKGQIEIPTQAQYSDALANYFHTYNQTRQRNLAVKPAELWAQLERIPVNQDLEPLYRIRHERQVRNWTVSLEKRKYRHNDLGFYDGQKIIIEIDPRSYDEATIRDLDGRYLCTAYLQHKHAYQASSRIEQAKLDRERAAIARKQKDIDEISRRAGRVIDAAEISKDLEDFQAPALPDRSEEDPGVPFRSGGLNDLDADYFSPSPSHDDDDDDPLDYL